MFFRFIGRLYFWLVLVPLVHRWVTPVIIDIITDVVSKQIENLPADQKARYDSIHLRRTSAE
jgi:hypothetical protein